MDNSCILKMSGISKIFPGVLALDNVDFSLKKGEVVGLVGENGAGKSTLSNILGGIIKQYKGRISLDGSSILIKSPSDAQRLGICFVHQEPKLFSGRDILSNIYIKQFPSSKIGFIQFKSMKKEAQAILRQLGIGYINLNEKVEKLNVGEQRLIEIARALIGKNIRILIMDEPTATIGSKETKILFSIIKNLSNNGTSIIYISHRIGEVFEICNRITVLRNGKNVVTRDIKKTNFNEVCKFIAGKEIKKEILRRNVPLKGEMIKFINFTGIGFKNVNLSINKGEIISLTGIVGSGCLDFARAIFGLTSIKEGNIILNGKKIKFFKNPIQCVKKGISFLSDDKKREGLFLERSVLYNITLASLKKYVNFLFISKSKQKKLADYYLDKLSIKIKNLDVPARNLSGGNQQKVIVARWLLKESDIFIFCQPTQGIDVEGKKEILKIINKLAKNNKAIIIVSDELDEILSISHRIIVFRDGAIIGEFKYPNFDRNKILKHMIGGSIG